MTSILSNRYRSLGTNPSMYESFNPLTTINKQHFVEWFSGSVIDSIWTFTNVTATGSSGMVDAVDEGAFVKTAASNNAHVALDFNNKRQYAHDNSIMIGVTKRNNTVSDEMVGFSSGVNILDAVNDTVFYSQVNTDTFKTLRSSEGTTLSATVSDVVIGTTFTGWKIENSSANLKLTLSGVLKVTKTTNRPNTNMQPSVSCRAREASAKETRVRFLEVYNT